MKSKVIVTLIVTILIFIVMGISAKNIEGLSWLNNAGNAIVAPFQTFFTFVENNTNDFITNFSDSKALNEKNEQLQTKIDELEKEKRELDSIKNENKQLREMLKIKDQFYNYKTVGANIIAKDLGNWFNVFNIDRGTADKVKINTPVISASGVVGKVVSSSMNSAKVLSIIDSESSISAIISKSMDYVIVSGDINLENEGLCRMNQIPIDLDLSVGDTVETSGIGGIFPKGLLIGSVKEIVQGNNELERYAIIKTAVDFRKLQIVFVLVNK